MAIAHLTEYERKISEMKSQLMYMLEHKSLERKIFHDDEEIIDYLDSLYDDEIEDLYDKYKTLIDKEQWVQVMHYQYDHISEFEENLRAQLIFDFSIPPTDYHIRLIQSIQSFYKEVGKYQLDDLTLDEKIELYHLTHPFIY